MAVPLPPMRRTREFDTTSPDTRRMLDATIAAWAAGSDASFAAFSRDRLQTIAAEYSFASPFICVCDEAGRFHCADGPAVMPSSGGVAKYFWHGVEVPLYVITDPSMITIESIDNTHNAEVRRAMLDRYGMQRYLSSCAAELVHEDTFGKLYHKRFNAFSEPLAFVRVRNSTAESDGTVKEYFLRVPPDMRTAQEAVAWTFGIEGDWAATYAPSVET